MPMQLYTFWRSQAAFRVRIALDLKGLDYERHSIDLLKGEQFSEDYRKVNPESVVPTLIDGDNKLVQSLAILEYLEETYPDPSILPTGAADRAHARAIGQVMAMEAHTLMVPRIRKYLETELGLDEDTRTKWLIHWSQTASEAVEAMLASDPRTGKFCLGDTPTIADICLVPHTAATVVLDKDALNRWPTTKRIFETCMAIDAFSSNLPLKQPGAPAQGH
jgi:maleylacetoacetate isomerase